MAYQALYRKFRPTTFDDIVGQKHITQTLKNEILMGRVGHAYLFTGIRGTGKTTTAKVFSRAINCLHNVDGSPCNECEICKGILDGSILDVVEMDAQATMVWKISVNREEVSIPQRLQNIKSISLTKCICFPPVRLTHC